MKVVSVLLIMLACSLTTTCQTTQQITIEIDSMLLGRADAEVPPTFPGGNHGWIIFLQNNLKADIAAENHAPPGIYRVQLNFDVDENGNPRNVSTLTRYRYGLEEEAIRVIKLSKWQPGLLKNKPVSALKKLTITFVVDPKPIAI